jgi:hypothetical protein
MQIRTLLTSLLIVFAVHISMAQSAPPFLSLNYDTSMAKVALQQRDFKTLSGRIKMLWNDGAVEQEFTTSVRIKKDSLIWMSMGIAGIEGLRLLISPDTIRILNKLSNEYALRDFSFIQKWLLLPVDFTMLQEILSGGKISIDQKAAMAGKEDSTLVLYLESDNLLETIRVDTAHYTPQKILLKDKLVKQDMEITFGAYNYSEAKPFSYQRSITIHRGETTARLEMEFSRVSFDEELTYPFDVPEKFKRVE